MKIMNLSFADSAGAAFSLAHALNKREGISSINLRANNNYINYPTIAAIRDYTEIGCRQLVHNADTVVFHTAIKPFYTALHLDQKQMKDKKKLLYFHGSDCRNYGKQIIEQADEMMGDYEVLVSTPDLLEIVPQAHWMPCVRSFSEISKRYGLCNQDKKALKAFGGGKTKIVLGHAPTNIERKGSTLFFRIITEIMQNFPHCEFAAIKNMPWTSCLRELSRCNILYDQYVTGAYGMVSVEAAIFKTAVFCRLEPKVHAMMEAESGLHQPFIQWETDDDLRTQSFMLVDNVKLQKKFGKMAYDYCKRIHDEKPVTDRFLKIVDGMD